MARSTIYSLQHLDHHLGRVYKNKIPSHSVALGENLGISIYMSQCVANVRIVIRSHSKSFMCQESTTCFLNFFLICFPIKNINSLNLTQAYILVAS